MAFSTTPAASGRRRAVSLLLALLVVAGLYLTRAPGSQYDFCSYYTAGLLLREGSPAASYDRAALNLRHARLHTSERYYGAFLYSPVLLYPAAAMSLLPFPVAEQLNHLLILAVLGGLLFFALQRAAGLGLRILLCLAFLLAHLVSIQFIQQNWSYLLVPLVGLGWWGARRERPALAALGWAGAAHLKLYAGLFLLPLAFAGRRRVVAWSVGVGLGLALLSLPGVGLASWLAWGRALAELAGGVTPFYNNVSLAAAIARATTEPGQWVRPTAAVAGPLVRGLFWVALVLLVWLLWRRRRDLEAGLALVVPACLLAVPLVWEHAEVLLLLLFLSPVLVPRAAALLALLLAASWPYREVVGSLFQAVLYGGVPAGRLELLLLFYPLLNLLVLTLLLAEGRRRTGVAVPAGDRDGKADGALQ